MVFTFFVYYSCRSPRSLLRRSTSFRVPPSLVFNNKTKLRRPIILHVLPFLLRESNDSYIFQTKVLPSVFFPFFFFLFSRFCPVLGEKLWQPRSRESSYKARRTHFISETECDKQLYLRAFTVVETVYKPWVKIIHQVIKILRWRKWVWEIKLNCFIILLIITYSYYFLYFFNKESL